MFDEAELRRMSPRERARLMQALAVLDMPRLSNAGSPKRRRYFLLVTVVCCVVPRRLDRRARRDAAAVLPRGGLARRVGGFRPGRADGVRGDRLGRLARPAAADHVPARAGHAAVLPTRGSTSCWTAHEGFLFSLLSALLVEIPLADLRDRRRAAAAAADDRADQAPRAPRAGAAAMADPAVRLPGRRAAAARPRSGPARPEAGPGRAGATGTAGVSGLSSAARAAARPGSGTRSPPAAAARAAPAGCRAARRTARPAATRSTGAGTHSSAGRCSARPSAAVNSALVTGAGAVRLTGPSMSAWSSRYRIAATWSASEIQLMYWRPEPSRAPSPNRNSGSQRAEHAAAGATARPRVRRFTTRSAAARAGSRGRLPVADQAGQETRSRRARTRPPRGPGVPVPADGRAGQQHRRAAPSASASAVTRALVLWIRLARSFCLRAARPPAARDRRARTGGRRRRRRRARPGRARRPLACGSQRTSPGRCGGRRTSRVTS